MTIRRVIAGSYEMNFETMPELRWRCGYLYAWALVVAAIVALAVLFRRINRIKKL